MINNKANTLYFSLPPNFEISIIFEEEVSFGKREELLLHAYVPGIKIMKIVRKNILNSSELVINYRLSKYKKVSYEDNRFVICDDWSKEIPLRIQNVFKQQDSNEISKKVLLGGYRRNSNNYMQKK